MDQIDYDKFRILEFVQNKTVVTRGKMTSEGLGRFQHLNMKTLYKLVDDMVENGLLNKYKEYIAGRRGPNPMVYSLSPRGLQWLKEKRSENRKTMKALK